MYNPSGKQQQQQNCDKGVVIVSDGRHIYTLHMHVYKSDNLMYTLPHIENIYIMYIALRLELDFPYIYENNFLLRQTNKQASESNNEKQIAD